MSMAETILDMDLSIDFTVNKEQILRSIAHLQGVVERKSSVAILSNILIDAKNNNQITLTTTDMDILASETIDCEVKSPGKITVPAYTLFEIIKKLDSENIIHISLKNTNNPIVEITSGKFCGKLPYMSPENFPIIEMDDYSSMFEITAAELRNIIDKTKFSISNEETRYYLNGIYLHTDDHCLSAVSTDLHRLSKAKMMMPEGANNFSGIIIPKKSIIELRKLIDDFNGLLTIKVSETKFSLELENIYFITKLIDGKFPDYNAVMPNNSPNHFTINKQKLIKSVELVAILAPDKTRNIKFMIENDLLTVTTNSEMYGNASQQLVIDYQMDDTEISFNARYVLDALNAVDSDNIKFIFSDSFSAVSICDPDDQEDKVRFVVMPTRG